MKNHNDVLLIAVRACAIVLMICLVIAPARSQPLAASPSNGDRGGDSGVFVEFDKAWRNSIDGRSNRESVVLIFRTHDGSYRGELQHFTNEYLRARFKWNPAAIAIVHTHPDRCDPRPSEEDKRIANKYGVPNFTITNSGMYVYDPATRRTSKVFDDLDWLKPANLPKLAEAMAQHAGHASLQAP